MADLRVLGIEERTPPLSLLWCQPYVPLQLDLREGENVQQLRLVLGNKPGNMLVVGLDSTTGALTTVSLEGNVELESDPCFVAGWRNAPVVRGRTLMDVAPWSSMRSGVLRDPRPVRVGVEGSCVVVVLTEALEPTTRHALNLSEVLISAGSVVGFAFPDVSATHLERLRANGPG